MSYINEAGEKEYTLDIPQREGKEGYIGTFLTSWLNIEAILKSPEFSREPIRLYYLAEAMVALIPDENERQNVLNSLDKRFIELKEKYLKEHGIDKLNDAEHSHLLIIASIRTLGLVTDYIDKHVGVSHKNKVGFVRKVR